MSEDESKNQNINMSDENNNEQKKEIKQVTIRFKFLDKLRIFLSSTWSKNKRNS